MRHKYIYTVAMDKSKYLIASNYLDVYDIVHSCTDCCTHFNMASWRAVSSPPSAPAVVVGGMLLQK